MQVYLIYTCISMDIYVCERGREGGREGDRYDYIIYNPINVQEEVEGGL